MPDVSKIGYVAIGRNEGERLVRCLRSIVSASPGAPIVYVDSGSTDQSATNAREIGAIVHELDVSKPFTAARARNAGARTLLEANPRIEAIQFVDGDCEVDDGWPAAAAEVLATHADVAIVCGRRRELYPDSTIYNALIDLEWDTSIGEAAACGGDALMRRSAFESVGGFRDDLIAGEEPELCVRLRLAGHRIMRIDAEMTRHDADIRRFGQAWRRSVRAGHATLEGYWIHRGNGLKHNRARVGRILVWGAILPLALVIATVAFWPWGLLGLGVFPFQWTRLAIRARGHGTRLAAAVATGQVIDKFAQLQGAAAFVWRSIRGRGGRLIEYK